MTQYVRILILITMSCCLAVVASAKDLSWQDVPTALKENVGTAVVGEWLISTGSVDIEVIADRADKAKELARKKSLLRAVQNIGLGSACRSIVETIPPEEQELFLEIADGKAQSLNFKGTQVLRQWEDSGHSYTTISVPHNEILELQCPYPDLKSAIAEYVNSGPVTLPGLEFGMRHVSRYSTLRESLRAKTEILVKKNADVTLPLLFDSPSASFNDSPSGAILFQQALYLSEQLYNDASRQAKNGNWPDALQITAESLKLSPHFSKPYLLLADYLLAQNQPALALLATEKAMQGGIVLREALEKLITAQKAMGSEEVEVFQYLLDNFSNDGHFSSPSFWQEELEQYRAAGAMAAYAVVASSGQALSGSSLAPDSGFGIAQKIYGQSKGDDDLLQALAHLVSAAQKQPFSADTYNLIGACYRNLGKPELALPFLWQALKLRPGYDFALTNLGLCCQKLGLNKAAGFYFGHDEVKKSTNTWVQGSYQKFLKAED